MYFWELVFDRSQLPFRHSRVTGLLEGRCKPFETFVQTISGGSASRLDELEDELLASMP